MVANLLFQQIRMYCCGILQVNCKILYKLREIYSPRRSQGRKQVFVNFIFPGKNFKSMQESSRIGLNSHR